MTKRATYTHADLIRTATVAGERGAGLSIYLSVTAALILCTIAVGFTMGTWAAVLAYFGIFGVVAALSFILAFGGRRG
jgi:hypothetical protein